MENVIYIELRMTSFNCVFKLDRRQPACVFTAILAIRCKLLGVTVFVFKKEIELNCYFTDCFITAKGSPERLPFLC